MALQEILNKALSDELILASTYENIIKWIDSDVLPIWALSSINELIEARKWDEIDNRFCRDIEFGTAGFRGRTIANTITRAELGRSAAGETPEHAAVGTKCVNDFSIIRATIALFRYTNMYLESRGRLNEVPQVVVAYDTRHFSQHFSSLCARAWTGLGGKAYLYDGPRSTPQLSFSVRHLATHAGVVITASHNPYQDNGYKVCFEDGAQVVSPHAEGMLEQFEKLGLLDLQDCLGVEGSNVAMLGKDMDLAYQEAAKKSIIDQSLIREHAPRVVFTPIHGTGATATIPLMKAVGVDPVVVKEQMIQDPNFPTVVSPNPENAEALSMAIEKAKEVMADLVIGTDPDGDRLAIAVKDTEGEYTVLSGNTTGVMLAAFRIDMFKAKGIIPSNGTKRAALIKTFVTSPLLEKIAHKNGLKVINTLTGFKYIGEKLRLYQEAVEQALLKQGITIQYDCLPLEKRRALQLEYGTFFVLGAEESCGYLCDDSIRDKDGNGAALAILELAAYVKSKNQTMLEYLDDLYVTYGYHAEALAQIDMEGPTGAQQIMNILASYRVSPPKYIGKVAVSSIKDFATKTNLDADGKTTPPQDFFMVSLANGYQYAVRASGTEPKIKFYIFASSPVKHSEELPEIKKTTSEELERFKDAIVADAKTRTCSHGLER